MLGPFPYIGGKRAIAPRIIALFPEHTTYVEAFAGGAQVFFRKPPSKVEVLNDLNSEITNFFRVCQAHWEELVRYLRFTLVSRTWFELLKSTDPATLTDVQRAARHFYLLKNSYAGLIQRKNFASNVCQPRSYDATRIPAIIEEVHARLARVQIECLPYEKVLAKYDRPKTLFYLDPPYYARKLYRYNLTHEEFVAMAALLVRLRGKFVLSLNDVPAVREIFRDFKTREIALPYTSQKQAGRRYREVLITNF